MKKKNYLEDCGAEYKRSLNHNYLVIRKPDKADEDYQYSMVIQNDISGLLPMEERISEGKEYIYYEISSMQPVGRVYEHKELDSATLETTIRGIINACRETEDYMIDYSRLIMDPACIFMSLDDGSIKLMFSPEAGTDDSSLVNVAEFFLERISRTDAPAALMAYRFYQTVRKENYVISDIERVLDECKRDKREDKSKVVEDYSATVTNTERISPELIERTAPPVISKEQRSEKIILPENTEKTGIPIWLPAVLATGALAALAGIIPGIGDSKSVKFAAAAILIVAVGVLVKSIISRIRNKKDMISSRDDRAENTERKFNREEYGDDQVSKKEHYGDSGFDRNIPMDFDKFFSDMPEKNLSQNNDDSGKTIFVEPDNDEIRNILIDRKHGREYEIDHFPFTIGKLQGTADLILNDRSVSRLHAGLFEENGHVYLQDYNSTNGTFLNGVQLMGEERAMLSAEDEVGIGKVCLEYR